jgi:hypothetical protein
MNENEEKENLKSKEKSMRDIWGCNIGDEDSLISL